MKQKIALGLGALATTLAVLPLFAAFEAHVINVTARIENALAVSTKAIDFGTVFPQEHLDKPLTVELSGSFKTEDRVDDVEYFIRQKPKCGVTTNNGEVLVGPTATGHVIVNPQTGAVTIDCGPQPENMPANASWGVLPDLCPYISKEGDEDNDDSTPSFHKPWEVVKNDHGTPTDPADDTWEVKWLDTKGRLAKSEHDEVDNWIIDLAVPCFGGYCAQDWEEFVRRINPLADPMEFKGDINDEHKVFGCDLWVEVSHVSEAID